MTPGQDEDQGLTEQSVGTDEQLFDGALADEAPKEESVVAEPEKAAPAEEGQPRTPDGKFATKEPDKPEPQPATAKAPIEEPDKGEHQVPSWRLREINAERADAVKRAETAAAEAADLRRQLAQFKPAETKAPERPDPLIDPEGFTRAIQAEMEDRFRAERGDSSMRFARKADPALFDKAYAAAAEAINRGDQLTKARIFNSRDPGEELIAWHKENETRREVGNDPAAYKQRALEEALKDPVFLAKAIEAARGSASGSTSTTQPNGGARPAVRLPPSLTGAARADAANSTEDGDLMSDSALFSQALPSSR